MLILSSGIPLFGFVLFAGLYQWNDCYLMINKLKCNFFRFLFDGLVKNLFLNIKLQK